MAITVAEKKTADETEKTLSECERHWADAAEKDIDEYLTKNPGNIVPGSVIRKHSPRCPADIQMVVEELRSRYTDWIIEIQWLSGNPVILTFTPYGCHD